MRRQASLDVSHPLPSRGWAPTSIYRFWNVLATVGTGRISSIVCKNANNPYRKGYKGTEYLAESSL